MVEERVLARSGAELVRMARLELDDETRRRLMEQSALVLSANRLQARGDPGYAGAFEEAAGGEERLAEYHRARGDNLRAAQALSSAMGCWFHSGNIIAARAAGWRSLALNGEGTTARMVGDELRKLDQIERAMLSPLGYPTERPSHQHRME